MTDPEVQELEDGTVALDEVETEVEPELDPEERLDAESAAPPQVFLTSAEIEVPNPSRPGPANPSPDGAHLAYLQRNQEGVLQLWICEVEGDSLQAIDLPNGVAIDEVGPQWSPDARLIAVEGSDPTSGRRVIWLISLETGEARSLANHAADDSTPRWSRNADLIAFVASRGGRSSICVADPDGNVLQLTHPAVGQLDTEPTWSNDNSRIGFLRTAFDGDIAGVHVWTVTLASGEQKQSTKKPANRRQLKWMPGKEQIAFVTDESEWENIAVVNPDNQSSWNLASESGDKTDPQFSDDGQRMTYSRALHGVVRMCERGTTGASADLIDAGDGIADAARWLPNRRVVYRYSPATGETRFVIQEGKKDAERLEIYPAVPWEAPLGLTSPVQFDFETSNGLKLTGRRFKPAGIGPYPVVIVLDDAAGGSVGADFRPIEQALSSRGFLVLTPTLPGRRGLGRKIQNALKNASTPEPEVSDISDAITAVKGIDNIDHSRISLVGRGFGGGSALLFAGARPGYAAATAVIDPIVDPVQEFDSASDQWRDWYVGQYGLPVANAARLSLRSPGTFAGTVVNPLLILETSSVSDSRRAQISDYAEALQQAIVPADIRRNVELSDWKLGDAIADFLIEQLQISDADKPAAMRDDAV